MITIPLADVVAFLQRRGADLACLEGAPWVWEGGCPIGSSVMAVDPSTLQYERYRPITDALQPALYLGRDTVCPAAMGWASEVLRTTFDSPRPCVIEDAFNGRGGSVCLWGVSGRLYARWTWTPRSAAGRAFREVQLDSVNPPTPAARLKAVLEYEMGRTC